MRGQDWSEYVKTGGDGSGRVMMDKKNGQVRTGRGHDMRGQDIKGKYMTGQGGSGKARTNQSPPQQ